MITQKAISAKIEHGVLEELERESFASGKKKNRIINDAIRMYIEIQDLKRYLECIRNVKQKQLVVLKSLTKVDARSVAVVMHGFDYYDALTMEVIDNQK